MGREQEIDERLTRLEIETHLDTLYAYRERLRVKMDDLQWHYERIPFMQSEELFRKQVHAAGLEIAHVQRQLDASDEMIRSFKRQVASHRAAQGLVVVQDVDDGGLSLVQGTKFPTPRTVSHHWFVRLLLAAKILEVDHGAAAEQASQGLEVVDSVDRGGLTVSSGGGQLALTDNKTTEPLLQEPTRSWWRRFTSWLTS